MLAMVWSTTGGEHHPLDGSAAIVQLCVCAGVNLGKGGEGHRPPGFAVAPPPPPSLGFTCLIFNVVATIT